MSVVPRAAIAQLAYDQAQQYLVGQTIGGTTTDASGNTVPAAPVIVGQPNLANMQVVIEPPILFSQQQFSSEFYLPFNNNRVYLIVQNQDATTLYLQFTGQSGTFSNGLQIAAGGYYEPYKAPVNAVAGSGAAGFVIEGIRQPALAGSGSAINRTGGAVLP